MNTPEQSRFHIYYAVFNTRRDITLGEAVLCGKRITFKPALEAHKWFELRPEDYLRQVRGIIRRLVREIGHTSCWEGRWDEPSGIGAERQ